MDLIDILGTVLGHKSSRPGKGTDVLKDILTSGPRSSRQSTPSGPPRSGDIEHEARELEDLLNVANERHTRRTTGQSRSTQRQPPTRPDVGFQQDRPTPRHHDVARPDRPQSNAIAEDDRALVLVRAMVNAAKSDGQIGQAEQQSILERLGNTSRETIEFLREEFARPLDVREFAASVPIGMEQQVYTMSLIAIDLDTGREAKYLLELARGLRIPAEVREQIHQRLGAPSVY